MLARIIRIPTILSLSLPVDLFSLPNLPPSPLLFLFSRLFSLRLPLSLMSSLFLPPGSLEMRDAVEFDNKDPASVYDISVKPIGQVFQVCARARACILMHACMCVHGCTCASEVSRNISGDENPTTVQGCTGTIYLGRPKTGGTKVVCLRVYIPVSLALPSPPREKGARGRAVLTNANVPDTIMSDHRQGRRVLPRQTVH